LGTTSLLDYAADLEANIRKLDAKPILIGHSMGGLLVQMLAARGLARAAILLAPASPSGIVAIRHSVVKSSKSLLTSWAFWRKAYRLTYDEVVYGMMQYVSEEERRTEYDKFVFDSGRAASEIGLWPFDPHHASRVDATKVVCPMLVVGAADDRHTPAAIVKKVWKKPAAANATS
jgi:pimeloyl-ACP methyl ester carboxylesterase